MATLGALVLLGVFALLLGMIGAVALTFSGVMFVVFWLRLKLRNG